MKKVLERIKNLNILVFGDVMLDRYVNGEVSRISPEAPVPVIRVMEEKSVAGGAANVALNLASLGASVESVGWFGKDEQGDELVEILCEKNIAMFKITLLANANAITKYNPFNRIIIIKKCNHIYQEKTFFVIPLFSLLLLLLLLVAVVVMDDECVWRCINLHY